MAPLEVIGAGCGRTASSSLREALRILGYEPYHMEECMKLKHWNMWLAADKDPAVLDDIFADFTATTDFPASFSVNFTQCFASMFYKELLARNPKAKVILSVRSPESWVKSVQETIWSPYFFEKHWLFRLILGSKPQEFCKMYRERLLGSPEPDHADSEALKRAFLAHTKNVKAHVPKGRLLVHEAKDGWAPICEFLGKEMPPTPYPRINDAASFQKPIKVIKNVLVLFYAGLAYLAFCIVSGALA